MKTRAEKMVKAFGISIIISAIAGIVTWNFGYFLATLLTLLILSQMMYEIDTTWSKSDKYE